jgi:hypothetical protein
MSFIVEQRPSDSPLVERVMHGHTASAGLAIRPAENHWHLVLTRFVGKTRMLAVGPLTIAGALPYQAGVELLWIKLKLGTFMPHWPFAQLLDTETPFPEATRQTFWLHGSAWQFPTYENADTFVSQLVRAEVLAHDPLVSAVLDHQPTDLSPRTVRYRFLRATGLSQNQIHQLARARWAEGLLRQGRSILDTVAEAGYADQPHLTRALKQWIGYTPAQLQRVAGP